MKNLPILFAFALCAISGFGQAGALDTAFGIGGKIIPAPSFTGYDKEMALQIDGKIVVAVSDNKGYFTVFRYLPNGAKDEGFGTNGQVITDFRGSANQRINAFANAVAVQPDGKIVVVGVGASPFTQKGDFALARYNPDGSLDSSFSQDGMATLSLGSGWAHAKVVALHEEKIVVAGEYSGDYNGTYFTRVALARFNADGSPDSSFSKDGWLTMAFDATPGQLTTARDMVVQSDGRIIVAGYYELVSNPAIEDFVLLRFKTNGSLDSTFSDNGKLRMDFGGEGDFIEAVALQPDGKIIAAGVSFGDKMAMARYLPNGSLDHTFGGGGKVRTAPDPNKIVEVLDMVVQPDRKIVVAGGTSGDGIAYSSALVRYNENGTLDHSFGVNGGVTTDFDPYRSYVTSVLLQPDGKILTLGFVGDASVQFFALARYLSGLSVGILDFSLSPTTLLVYPNPVSDVVMLEYELQHSEIITIQLFDMQGRAQRVFVQAEEQTAGPHRQAIRLPKELPAGHYVLCISNTEGRVSIQIVK